MFLTDNEYLKLNKVLIIISNIISMGYSGKDDFLEKAKTEINNTNIEIELVEKAASRLELLIF